MSEDSGWKHRGEWYMRRNKELTKVLLKINDIALIAQGDNDKVKWLIKIREYIKKLNLESGWNGKGEEIQGESQ